MNGDLITTRIFDEQTLHQSTSTSGWRRAYGELQLGYDRTFGRHRVGGLLFYYMQSYSEMASVATHRPPTRYSRPSPSATWPSRGA